MNMPVAAATAFPARGFRRACFVLALAGMIGAFLLMFLGPLWDIDLWWHLATGREIVRNSALPSGDPFNYPPAELINPASIFLLKGYWLAQSIFYLAHAMGGDQGVVLLRATVLLAILLVILVSCRRRKVSGSMTLLALAVCGFLAKYYTGERPQLFTMLCAALLFWLLDEVGYGQRDPAPETSPQYNLAWAWAVPPVMLLWANLHPGFLLGSLFICLYLGCEWGKFVLFKYPRDRQRFFAVSCILLLALAMTVVNPNGMSPYTSFLKFQGATVQQSSSEYLSPWELYRSRGLVIAPYWLYLPLLVGALLSTARRWDVTRIFVCALLILMSLQAFRYLPYLVFGTVVYTATVMDRYLRPGTPASRLATAGAAIVVCLVLIAGGSKVSSARETMHSPLGTSSGFPEEAVTFMQREKPAGQMFNHFNWGGYLSWRLGQGYKTLLDGRNLRSAVFEDYKVMLWIEGSWRQLFDKYGINTVVFPAVDDFTGELYGLANFLYKAEEWHLVFADPAALVLVRGAENAGIVSRCEIPKRELYRHVVERATFLVNNGLQTVHLWRALATAYVNLGQTDRALDAQRMAQQFR